MTMRPSTAPQRVPLPSPPTSSLPDGPDPESDSLRAASPTVTRFLATAVTRWHDTLRTTLAALGFAPSTADPSLFLRTDTTLSPFYVRVYVDDLVFATADTEALAHVKSELQKRHTCTDLGELTSYLGLRITRDRAQRTITLTQSHMVQHVLQRFGFTYSSPHSTPLPTGHSLSAPPSDESVEPSGPCPELVGCLIHKKEKMDAAKRVLRYLCSTSGMGLVLGGQTRVVFTGHADASWADDLTTQWSSQGYTFSLGSGCVSWRSTRSSSVLSSSCEAEIYAGAMAALELRWLTYLLANLGEPPRSPPVVYVDNKAMIALCREHKLEHRMKHIALRYFLAQELQQRGQLRLAYVASRSDTADVFTKALQPCDHHSFCTVLGLVDAVEPVEVATDSGASRGAEPGCAESGGAASGGATPGGAEPWGAGSGGAEPGVAEPGGAGSGGAEPERAEPWGTASGGADPGAAGSGGAEPARAGPGGPSGTLSRRELPSPQELREWFARRWSRTAGAGGAASAGGSAATGGAGAGGATGAGPGGSTSAGGARAAGPGGARPGGTRAAGPAGAPSAGAGGAAGVGATGGPGAGEAGSAGGPAGAGAAGGTGAGGAAGVGAAAEGVGVVPAGSGRAARPRPYFVPLLEQVLGLQPSFGPAPSLECPPPVQSESQLQLASPLPAPSPYTGPTGGLAEHREPESRPASPVRTARTSRRVPRPLPPAAPGTHQMTLRPSTAPQRVPLPSPPASSLPTLADPASDSLRAASPTVTRLLAAVVTDPSFESIAASALVTELVDFAAHCRLDFATSLVAESASVCPPSVGGECALSTDVLEDRQEEFQCFAAALPYLAIEGPYSSQWQAAMDAEMASWKSTGTYVDEVPPHGANIVSGMWIFRGVDYFQTFSPTPKMTTLRVLLHVAAQHDYELHSLDFSTAFLQGSLHEEIWLRRPPGFTGSFPAGTQWSLRSSVYSPLALSSAFG
ncbi:unnamed protein product [Closterium sp. NIES-53]